MEESGITKVISVRLENESGPAEPIPDPEPYEEEEVEAEEGRELPAGIDDPALVSEETLHPIRTALNAPVDEGPKADETPQDGETHDENPPDDGQQGGETYDENPSDDGPQDGEGSSS
jgi:hypothetical protein